MKMTFNKVLIIYVTSVALLFIPMYKMIHVQSVRWDVRHAASCLIREQSRLGKEISFISDKDIIIKKILPKSQTYYTLNPFTWTLKQMSVNDDLLQACIDAKERDDAIDAAKYKVGISTFEKRFKTWEINLEKAKQSL